MGAPQFWDIRILSFPKTSYDITQAVHFFRIHTKILHPKYQTTPLSPGSGISTMQPSVIPILPISIEEIPFPSLNSDCIYPHLPSLRPSGASSKISDALPSLSFSSLASTFRL